MREFIQVMISILPKLAAYTSELEDIWISRWMTNMGDKHKKLEAELLEYLAAQYIVLFTNGHLALETTLEALNLSGEVITTPFTFASTTHAIVRCGLEPVFCDINQYDYTIDPDQLEALITEKTSGILPVHVYGNVCKHEKIQQIVDKYNLKVIYDAAHAFGIKHDNNSIANLGDVSMFSFHATKVFHTIEGGAVTFKDENLKPILNGLKNFGITGPESVEYIGGNAKMNEFQAAMGLCNLRIVDHEIETRSKITERYNERLNGIKGIKLNIPQKGVTSNHAYYPVLFDGNNYNRDQVFENLRKENIFARKYFYPLTSDYQCYKGRFNSDHTPVAQYVANRILTLPLYADLALTDVDRICDIILRKRCLPSKVLF